MGANGSSQGNITQTDFGYTGQRDLDGTGLMDYKARFYDGSLGRFIQPDTIVSNPINPQTWNRYTYVSNNPVNRTDPTGHRETGACGVNGEECGGNIPPGNGGGSGGGGNPGGGSNECNLGEVCIPNSHTGEPELIADDGNTGVYSACGYKFMNSIAPGEFGNDKTCSEDYWLTIPRNRVWEYQYYGVARPGWLGALMPNFCTFASYIPFAGSTISTMGTVTNMANGA